MVTFCAEDAGTKAPTLVWKNISQISSWAVGPSDGFCWFICRARSLAADARTAAPLAASAANFSDWARIRDPHAERAIIPDWMEEVVSPDVAPLDLLAALGSESVGTICVVSGAAAGSCDVFGT